jgi:hypothetical protein
MSPTLDNLLDQLAAAAATVDVDQFEVALTQLETQIAAEEKLQPRASGPIGRELSKVLSSHPGGMALWRRANTLFQFDGWHRLAYFERLRRDGYLIEALEVIKRFANNRNWRIQYLKSMISLYRDFHDRSRVLYFCEMGVLEFEGRSEFTHFLKARAETQYELGAFEEAIADFYRLKFLHPAEIDGYIGLARTFCVNRSFASARAVLSEARLAIPDGGKLLEIEALIVGANATPQEILDFLGRMQGVKAGDGTKVTALRASLRNTSYFKSDFWQTLLQMFAGNPRYENVIRQHETATRFGGQYRKFADAPVDPADDSLSGLVTEAQRQIWFGNTAEAIALCGKIDQRTADWPGRSETIARLIEWLRVHTGDVGGAQKHYWKRQETRRPASRRSELSQITQGPAPEGVVVFTQIRNEMANLPSFIKYHQKLGVSNLVVIDNGSDDGSTEYLARLPFVTLFQTGCSFRRAGAGADWFNALSGHKDYADVLCLRLDADERFVYPHCDKVGVSVLWDYMQVHGYDAIAGMMVDLFPRFFHEIEQSGDHIGPSVFFDSEIESHGSLLAPYTDRFGSKRLRSVDHLPTTLSKIPGTRGGGTIERIGAHRSSPALVADVGCALLHYKYRADLAARAQEELKRQQYAQNGNAWAQFPDFKNGANEMTTPSSKKYRSWTALIDSGLLQNSEQWSDYIKYRTKNSK